MTQIRDRIEPGHSSAAFERVQVTVKLAYHLVALRVRLPVRPETAAVLQDLVSLVGKNPPQLGQFLGSSRLRGVGSLRLRPRQKPVGAG